MVSQLWTVGVARPSNSAAIMDAIKKKMQAMKVEKDNAMDRYIINNGSTYYVSNSNYFTIGPTFVSSRPRRPRSVLPRRRKR